MLHALNMTMPLKQDSHSQQELQKLKAAFAHGVQQAIGDALAESELVHFARVVVIDNKYIQVLTEYDGDKTTYALFFLEKLPKVFEAIFALVEGVPAWDQLQHPDKFLAAAEKFNVQSLGTKDDDPTAGWLFSAVGTKTVKDIKRALAK